MINRRKFLQIAPVVSFCLWILTAIANSFIKNDLLFAASMIFFDFTLIFFTLEALLEKKISLKGMGDITSAKNPKTYWVTLFFFACFSVFLTGMLLKLLLK